MEIKNIGINGLLKRASNNKADTNKANKNRRGKNDSNSNKLDSGDKSNKLDSGDKSNSDTNNKNNNNNDIANVLEMVAITRWFSDVSYNMIGDADRYFCDKIVETGFYDEPCMARDCPHPCLRKNDRQV